MRDEIKIISIVGIGLCIGATVSFALINIPQTDTQHAKRQTQWASSSLQPFNIELEGVVESYDQEKRELLVLTPLPYDLEKKVILNVAIPENTHVAIVKETYGPEGSSVVYGSRDSAANETEFVAGRPLFIRVNRTEQRFTASYIRIFLPQT